jgi:penicillin-binding protein 1A
VRHKVFDDGVAHEATQILEKNVQGGTGTKAQIGCPAAGKTGTVDNFTDAWFVGYTPRLVTSVWVGHPKDPYPLGPNAQGGAIAAPIWGAYMKSAKGKFCGDFAKPKVPFTPQPFFGKYARLRVQTPGDDKKDKDGKSDNGKGKDGGNGGAGGTNPDAYESPPQEAPTTQQPGTDQPSQQGGTGQNGGTAPPPG